jgi:general secretion pathway protein D
MKRWPPVVLVSLLLCFLMATCAAAAMLSDKEVEEAGRQVTMDFREVEIGTLIKFIGELTNKNFIIDERVKGKVTVISPTKITVEEAYKVFESILEVHGYATVPAGKVIKVVPAVEARGKSIDTAVGTEIVPAADTLITQIIPIKYANVREIKTIFTPLVSKESLLVTYEPTNTLIVTDSLSNINRLLKILQEVDIAGYALELAVVPLEYASAETVAREIKTLFEAKTAAGGPRPKVEDVQLGSPGELKIIPDERTNSIIVLANAQGLTMIKGVIAKLDQDVPRGRGNLHVYYLQHAVADDLAKILSGMTKETGGGAQGGKAAPLVVTEKINILADKTTNSLIITASPQDYVVLEEVIKKLDIVRAQVYVDCLIAEVTLDKVRQLGVEWNATQTPDADGGYRRYGGSDLGMLDALKEGALKGLVMAVTKGYITAADGSKFPDIKALVHFYSGDTDVNILSAPRILTTDNQEAQIVVGEERPFLKAEQTSVSAEGSTIRTWDYKDVGITLKLTPHISKGKLLRLDIFTEIKTFVEDVKGLTGAAITSKRQATTSVVVEDESTVVIAGLIRDDRTGSVAKVPILGDVPLLGWLFRSKTQNKTKTNLLIFITPHIITSTEAINKITKEEQERRDKAIEDHRKQKKSSFPLFED